MEELLERIEEGMTTVADADLVRDLIDRLTECESGIGKDLAALYGYECGLADGEARAKGGE